VKILGEVNMMSLFNRWRGKGFSRPDRSEAGASLAEVVVMTPMLLLILFGMTDLGRWAFLAIEVSSAARAGAQYGGQNRGTALDSSGIQTAARNDVSLDPLICATCTHPLTVSSSASCACSSNLAVPVSCNLSSCSTSQLIPILTVTTSASYTPWILYGVFTSAVTVNGQAVVLEGQ
jgi:hypothetical protein